jgi:glycosyltransferase involved in cell wall biosynthesis
MQMGDTSISAIVITLNEEACIASCLESLAWTDEVVVVDSGSVDRTEEICRSFPNVRFINNAWPGYGPQKNFALSHASTSWIISLDADEVVSPELAREVIETVGRPCNYNGFRIMRKNYYRNHWVRHSGWWPDEIIRVFRKDSGRFNDRIVHESVEVNGRVGSLPGVLEHRSFHGAEDFLDKALRYSVPGAKQMKQAGKRGGAVRALVRAAATFFKIYILKRGILDGRDGLLIAVSGAVGVFYRIIKLTELYEDTGAK